MLKNHTDGFKQAEKEVHFLSEDTILSQIINIYSASHVYLNQVTFLSKFQCACSYLNSRGSSKKA